MADDKVTDEVSQTPEGVDEEDGSYKPPPEKTLQEIIEADKDDESLQKYKATLLGKAMDQTVIIGKSHFLTEFCQDVLVGSVTWGDLCRFDDDPRSLFWILSSSNDISGSVFLWIIIFCYLYI